MGHSEFDCVNEPYPIVYLNPPVGKFHPRRTCAEIEGTELECENLGETGGCPGEPGRPGEDCVNPAIVVEGTYYFTNICSTTDGPASYPVCDNQNDLQIAADVWYEYHACESVKRIDIDVCNSDFDTVLAVYTNGTPNCPACDDPNLNDYLEPIGCRDYDCPWGAATAAVFADVVDQCFLIRVGGYNGPYGEPGTRDTRGNGELEIGCGGCYPSSEADPELINVEGTEFEHQKMRYLSFHAGDPAGTGVGGRSQAIRITFMNLPAPYDVWNDVQMWVQEPETFCQNAGVVNPPCPSSYPFDDWMGATLGCEPWFGDFYSMTRGGRCAAGTPNKGDNCEEDADCGRPTPQAGDCVQNAKALHVYHEGIIPGGVYWIEVTEAGCQQAGFPEGSFSPPLEMQQSIWGDLMGSCAPYPCTPPDGEVGIPTDVTATLDKFKNLEPPLWHRPAVTKVRADHDWCTPNRRIDISDVTFCLDAFRGVWYPPPAFTTPAPGCVTLPTPPCP